MSKLTGLNHLTLCVSDLTRSLAFYAGLLGLRLEVSWERGAYLSLGALWLCLSLEASAPAQDHSHIALGIDSADFAAFAAQLQAAGVPQWKQNRSEGASLYILDPDGHKLEIHVGDLASRLQQLQSTPYAGLVWHRVSDLA